MTQHHGQESVIDNLFSHNIVWTPPGRIRSPTHFSRYDYIEDITSRTGVGRRQALSNTIVTTTSLHGLEQVTDKLYPIRLYLRHHITDWNRSLTNLIAYYCVSIHYISSRADVNITLSTCLYHKLLVNNFDTIVAG